MELTRKSFEESAPFTRISSLGVDLRLASSRGCARRLVRPEAPNGSSCCVKVTFPPGHGHADRLSPSSVLENPTTMSKVVFGPSPLSPPSAPHLGSLPPPVGNVPYNMGEARFIPNIYKNPNSHPSHRGYTGSTHRCFQISRSGSRFSVRIRSSYAFSVNPSPHFTQSRV